MGIEEPQNFESRESVIDKMIENLAEREGMNPDDILSDIVTFLELSREDGDAVAYLEEVAERIGIPLDELMEYATKKAEEI
jgi:hypothetical protein